VMSVPPASRTYGWSVIRTSADAVTASAAVNADTTATAKENLNTSPPSWLSLTAGP
jgi:hypothetical protein